MSVEFEVGNPLGLEDVLLIMEALKHFKEKGNLNNETKIHCSDLIITCEEALEEMGL